MGLSHGVIVRLTVERRPTVDSTNSVTFQVLVFHAPCIHDSITYLSLILCSSYRLHAVLYFVSPFFPFSSCFPFSSAVSLIPRPDVLSAALLAVGCHPLHAHSSHPALSPPYPSEPDPPTHSGAGLCTVTTCEATGVRAGLFTVPRLLSGGVSLRQK